jgi:hypothetical protein
MCDASYASYASYAYYASYASATRRSRPSFVVYTTCRHAFRCACVGVESFGVSNNSVANIGTRIEK